MSALVLSLLKRKAGQLREQHPDRVPTICSPALDPNRHQTHQCLGFKSEHISDYLIVFIIYHHVLSYIQFIVESLGSIKTS